MLTALPPRARAGEGQWTPDQIAELYQAHQAEFEAAGLELTPEELWSPDGDETNGGLMRAAVNLSGCSAAFVSPQGLIATNHHCAYRALQAQSTVEADYLTGGFLARTRAEELEAKGSTVRIVRRVEDVTDKIRAAAAEAEGDAARARAIARAQKALVAACEQKPAARCDVAAFYGGSQMRLFEYLELRDVRLVYAPPAAVGEYGGEIDNWMWPRHTGDFALLRAYVGAGGAPADHASENVPYEPEQHLAVSAEGVSPGEFVAVLGYPGRTRRYMPAAEVERWVSQVLPGAVELYGEWLDILTRRGRADEAVRIKVAALEKSLANRHKNARGMLDGIAHMGLVEARRTEDARLRKWAAQAENRAYRGVLEELDRESARARRGHDRAQLLDMLRRGPNLLAAAIHLVRRAEELQKPDLDRADDYMARDQQRLRQRVERHLRDFDPGVDSELLASLLARNAALPKDQRIAPFTRLAGAARGDRAGFQAPAAAVIEASKLADPALVDTLWEQPDQALTHPDPALDLARRLVRAAIVPHERAEERAEGARARLLPRYFEMLRAVREGPIYPDANGTLRFSYATVKGYDKWDGATQKPQTVLAGAVAKHTGEAPFDLPQAIRDHAGQAGESRFADAAHDDLALCFLATADTTGGNSGSPVIDGKGRLVGLNFDRVWENIAGDFAYHDGHSRNVSVDIRYLLWMLDEVAGADPLLAELGVAAEEPTKEAKASADEGAAAGSETSAKAEDERTEGKRSGCGCRAGAVEGDPGAAAGFFSLLLLGWAGLLRRRRRRQAVSAPGARPDAGAGEPENPRRWWRP